MTDAAMRRRIRAIPEDGWWRLSGEEGYQALAVRLREYGVPAEVVADVLTGAFNCAAAEYGD